MEPRLPHASIIQSFLHFLLCLANMKRISDFIGAISSVKFPVNWRPNEAAPPQQTNQGTATYTTDLQTGLSPDGGSVSLLAETIYDTCAYLIHCSKHKKVGVSRQSSSGAAWLPFIPLPSNISWNDGALYGSYLILSNGSMDAFHAIRANIPYKEAYIAQVFKLQLPQTLKCITRLIFYIRLDSRTRNRNFKCCQEVGRIEWLPLETLVQGKVNRAWGHELIEFARWIKKPTRQEHLEYSLEDAYTYVPRDPSRNLEEAMLKTANVSERDVERLYLHFMQHCFPSFGMTIWSFRAFMLKWDIENDEQRLVRLFHAFNYNRNGFISFHELLLGLACIEQCTSHGTARVKFVFRFYDQENKGVLDEADFRRMVRDIIPRNMLPEYEEKVAAGMALFAQTGNRFSITYEDFYKAVAVTCKFRRTSTLCRSPKAIFASLTQAMVKSSTKSSLIGKKTDEKITGTSNRATCHSCKEKPKPMLMPYYLPIGTNRQPLDPVPLPVNSNAGIEKDYHYLPSNPAMQMLTAIRQFAPVKGTLHSPNGLLMKDTGKLMKLFEWLHEKMLTLFDTSEGKWMRSIRSPCFVIGDIHGNLEDLLSLERVIWYGLPRGANLVFLGDYVDRGKWGVECAFYVMALKALYPHKVTLLRGNHEIRTIQQRYSFEGECTSKYGGSVGNRIWDMLNRIFDRMPVVATIDDSFFCAHGGIPHPNIISTLADLDKEPLDIPQPDEDSEAVWHIVWSDPMENAEFERQCEMQDEDEVRSMGFIKNTKRSAGHWFNEKAVDKFCATNQLTHIVRAHQPNECGFMFAFHDKCLTIFSCSHYCGQNNEAAVLYLDQEAARAIRIDTHNNAPATDR